MNHHTSNAPILSKVARKHTCVIVLFAVNVVLCKEVSLCLFLNSNSSIISWMTLFGNFNPIGGRRSMIPSEQIKN